MKTLLGYCKDLLRDYLFIIVKKLTPLYIACAVMVAAVIGGSMQGSFKLPLSKRLSFLIVPDMFTAVDGLARTVREGITQETLLVLTVVFGASLLLASSLLALTALICNNGSDMLYDANYVKDDIKEYKPLRSLMGVVPIFGAILVSNTILYTPIAFLISFLPLSIAPLVAVPFKTFFAGLAFAGCLYPSFVDYCKNMWADLTEDMEILLKPLLILSGASLVVGAVQCLLPSLGSLLLAIWFIVEAFFILGASYSEATN